MPVPEASAPPRPSSAISKRRTSPRRPLARLVEEDDPAGLVEHADERLGRLGEDPCEGAAEDDVLALQLLAHRVRVPLPAERLIAGYVRSTTSSAVP